MKKRFVVALLAGAMLLLSVTASAAVAPKEAFTCPNGNTVCVENGTCANNGECGFSEGCPNGNTPKRDGTGSRQGQGMGMGMGRQGRGCRMNSAA